MSAKHLDEEGLFHAARRIESADARELFLNQACGDDAGLAARVRALLEMHAQDASEFHPPVNGTVDFAPISEKPGSMIGPYKLKEQIGEGGFGLVFVAEQMEPVKRKVALKVIKPGMDTREVMARFTAERQALALMDHPNIARVLDAGATDSGRPYFVMELVRGIPITEYCDQNQLSPRDRLDLFVTVCQAVQHAHQKGIIHRDIKPSNVLVTSHDGKPVAKVIDFGVAKAISQQLTAHSVYTNFAQMIGTPLYMSPEQAEMSGLDIDTRSDIYSLGVLLYELLTGSTPLEKKKFAKAAYDEIRRLIREEEPQKPSTRLSTSDSIASIAAQRHMEPAKLSKLMRGDLDWITMKALEKDRTRRYETANGLARDIQRYLSDEPVEACPPSATYRLKKFAKKNRAALTTAATIALLLVGGIAVSAWQAVRARNAERVAQDAAIAEKQANEQSQKRLTQIEKGNEIITSIFADLDIRKVKHGTEPLEALLAQRLAKAAEQLEGEAIGDPLVVAGLQTRLGESLFNLGHAKDAIPLLTKASETRTAKLGPEHPDTLTSMGSLGVSYLADGKLDLALPLLEETFKIRKAKLGADHVDTLTSMGNLASGYQAAAKYDLALPLEEETFKLKKAKLGVDHPDTLNSMHNLAIVYDSIGKLDLAMPLLEESLKLRKAKLGADHPDTLFAMTALASVYQSAFKPDLALPLFDEALKLMKTKLGTDHPDTLRTMHLLAGAYEAISKLDLAVPLLEECLKLRKARLGPDHPDTIESMTLLARFYSAAGKLDLALPLIEETFAKQKAKFGPDHPATLVSMNILAECYRNAGKLELALPLWEESLKHSRAKLGADHPATLMCMNNMAMAYQAIGKLDLALPLFEETLKLSKAKMGADHPSTLLSMHNLAAAYRDAGQLDKAVPLAEESLSKMSVTLGPDHSGTLAGMNNLANAYRAAGQPEKALPLIEQSLAKLTAKFGPDHPDTLQSKNSLALAYQESGQIAKAVLLYEETLAKQKAKRGPDHPDTLQCMNNLALAYQESGQVAKALPLHEERLEKMKAKFGPDHPETLLSMNNLALAYKASGQLDKAVPLFEQSLAKMTIKLGPEHPSTILSLNNLATAYQTGGQLDKALPLYEQAATGIEKRKFRHEDARGIIANTIQAYESARQFDRADDWRRKWLTFLKQDGKGDSPAYAGELTVLGLSLLKQEKWAEAETKLRESVAIREKSQPDVWTTFNTMSTLGGALLGQKKYAEAEPLLLKGYQGMKQREEKIPKNGGAELRIPQALDRMIEFYTATNKPDEVTKWQAERAKYPEPKKEPEKK
jgi:serine/threonine protein kinase/Tfp pilus assembly protein PilF